MKRGGEKIAGLMAVVNTYILLSLLFFLVITPVGLIMRMFGKSVFAYSDLQSHWKERSDEEDLERQF